MPDGPIRLLLIEDSPDDALLIEESVMENARERFRTHWSERLADGLDWLRGNPTDVILLDLSLPDSHGLETFSRVHEAVPEVPIVLLTNLEDERMAVQAVQSGAQDYLMKSSANGPLLTRSILYALERQRLNDELHERTQELERSNRDLEQFASAASHDLQEPLRMVRSYMELLTEDYSPQLDAEAQQYVAFAHDGAVRMQQLVQDLLAYSRVGSEGRPFEPVDTAALLRNVLHDLQQAIADGNAAVTGGELPGVRGDRTQLGQLLQNLVSNALKFRGDRDPRVEVACRRDRGHWIFSVRDNGIGIAVADQTRIFDMFSRLHHRSEYAGTGIGLAVCRRIVERHGGRIWLHSEPGQGTTFFFSLAAEEPAAAGQ